MKAWPALFAFLALVAATPPPTLSAMQGNRRILLIAAPSPQDARARAQRRILSRWSRQAADRDISLVEVSGQRVNGAADDAAALARRFALKADKFQVLLIGKDGHVALRSAQPVAADTLQATIDAMPMRMAGQR